MKNVLQILFFYVITIYMQKNAKSSPLITESQPTKKNKKNHKIRERFFVPISLEKERESFMLYLREFALFLYVLVNFTTVSSLFLRNIALSSSNKLTRRIQLSMSSLVSRTPVEHSEAQKAHKFSWQQTMLRIKDPAVSLPFYKNHFGFDLIHQYDFPQV